MLAEQQQQQTQRTSSSGLFQPLIADLDVDELLHAAQVHLPHLLDSSRRSLIPSPRPIFFPFPLAHTQIDLIKKQHTSAIQHLQRASARDSSLACCTLA